MVSEKFPQVYLTANKENLGFAKANNQALPSCLGRYILFLNPDTEIVDNAFKKMVELMDLNQEVDGLGCKLVFPDGSLQRSCRHFPSLFIDFMESTFLSEIFPDSGFFNRYHMGSWNHDTMREVDQPFGASLLFRKETMDAVGLMDERFFMYYDEVDLCYRVKKGGGEIYFTPDITVIHYANQSSNQVPEKTQQRIYKSKLLFFEKHYGSWSIGLLKINLAIRRLIVNFFFKIPHLLFGRPRDLSYFKDTLKVLQSVYGEFPGQPSEVKGK